MSDSAHVTSLDAMRDFRAALIGFREETISSLDAMRQEVHKAIDWLEHDRGVYWRERVRKGFDDISAARIALENCRRRGVAGHKPSCIEEQAALKKAKDRLATAQEKVELVRRWSQKVREEADEFRARVGQLSRCIENDLPQAVALLERMLAALEEYADLRTGEEAAPVEPAAVSPFPPLSSSPLPETESSLPVTQTDSDSPQEEPENDAER